LKNALTPDLADAYYDKYEETSRLSNQNLTPFHSVGGDILDKMLLRIRVGGRIAVCGAVSGA
jgi:hypothetical protein